jgi:transposase
VVLPLLRHLETLEARLNQNASHSSRPLSTDAPAQKRQRKPGCKPGHPGHTQVLFEPTSTVALFPDACACGHHGLGKLTPYHTHQLIKLPIIQPAVRNWIVPQGRSLACGNLCQAPLAADQARSYGPRLTGFVGEMAGIVRASRNVGQGWCASVFGISLSKRAIQKMVERVAKAIVPYYIALREVARAVLVRNSREELS